MSGDAATAWDEAADAFDLQPDHGLDDPGVRAAWTGLVRSALPPAPALVIDLGSGTGTLSVLAAGLGHRVHGIDLSSRMIDRARRKAAEAVSRGARANHDAPDARAGGRPSRQPGPVPTFARADASRPPFRDGCADAIVCRHVLWALADPSAAVSRWAGLLVPGGRLVLVEGRWSTGAGLSAERVQELVEPVARVAIVRDLGDASFWGQDIDDDRYVVVAERR